MEDAFLNISNDIANAFIRDVVFIDERAYSNRIVGEQQAIVVNEFDASAVSAIFCKAGKICAIYAPQQDVDIINCYNAIEKADVVVLDWNLQLESTQEYDPMADADNDERGKYTKQIIDKILKDAEDSKVKLIIIYTGESDLNEINRQIVEGLPQYGLTIDDPNIACCKKNVRIVVRAKETAHFNHIEQYRDKIIKYEDLPSEIVAEFTKLTMGLLSNYALSAMTAIRNNTSNILGIFSRDIDAAFLGHYVSVDNSDDAVLMLSELLGSAISDLIKAEKIDIKSWINLWIDYFASDSRDIQLAGKRIQINSISLKNILNITSGELYQKLNTAGFNLAKGKEDGYKKEAIKLFCTADDTATPNYKFAQLVQHKDIFSKRTNSHKLSTGTIVKYVQNEHDEYLLCIQQRCDSVRINNGERRNFLFLPLRESPGGEAIVINQQTHLIVNNKSYALKLYEFTPKEGETQITTNMTVDGKSVFNDCNGNSFEWIAELKNLFAQHLVSTYVSELSRVGIDNSEWIRLIGKNS